MKTPLMDDYREAHEISELRGIFNFEKQVAAPQYFATFDQRLLATALDWLFVSGFFILIAFTISLFLFDTGEKFALLLTLIIIIPVSRFCYQVVLEASEKQATYGKQILNIKVCDIDGTRLTLKHSLIRNSAKLISVLTLFTGYLASFFNKRQQCLHDMIAGTMVIKDRLI